MDCKSTVKPVPHEDFDPKMMGYIDVSLSGISHVRKEYVLLKIQIYDN